MIEGYTPTDLLNAYAHGLFLMADDRDTPAHWYTAEQRGQLPITSLHIPRSLKKYMRKTPYHITINQDFEAVIKACAAQTTERTETWINEEIEQSFITLHQQGHAHSVEYRDETGQLLGGLYGLSLGGTFCGESMFSRSPNASKIALIHLCARLYKGGYKILDTQFKNDHLGQFGIYEISHQNYLAELHRHLTIQTDFLLHGINEKEILEEYWQHRQTL